jgi:hypothetical protein
LPRRHLRLRVGGLTLEVAAGTRTAALDPPAAFEPFLAQRGADIRLDLVEARPPHAGELLFESGGAWQVNRFRDGLIYSFRAPLARPAVYKAVTIDARLTRGTLFFPFPDEGARPAYALDYPLDELLFQHRLVRDGALEVHACGLVAAGKVALFCGQSGAGKSTTARLWRRHRPRTAVLSDDRIVLRPSRSGIFVYGTPWHGDGGFARAARGRAAAIFFLKHASRSAAVRLAAPEAAGRLFARSFPPPWDAAALGRALDTCIGIATALPCFELGFRPDATAIEAALEAIRR